MKPSRFACPLGVRYHKFMVNVGILEDFLVSLLAISRASTTAVISLHPVSSPACGTKVGAKALEKSQQSAGLFAIYVRGSSPE